VLTRAAILDTLPDLRMGSNRRGLFLQRAAPPSRPRATAHSGPKTIALTPPARDAILGLPRDSRLVFSSKTGRRLSQTTMAGYWSQVLARAGLDFDFYHATKHYGVHYLWATIGLSRRAIAAQAGWSLGTVDRMLGIYGHGDIGALEEVDQAFAGAQVVPLRKVEGGMH
jgi:hypothetical protein